VTIAHFLYRKYIFTPPPDYEFFQDAAYWIFWGLLTELIHFVAAGVNIVALACVCSDKKARQAIVPAQPATGL